MFGLILDSLLDGKVQREYGVAAPHVDYFVEDFGFIELTMSRNIPALKKRSRWYLLAKRRKVWILVPRSLVPSYSQSIGKDVKLLAADPQYDFLRGVRVVSYDQLFKEMEIAIGTKGLYSRAMGIIALKKPIMDLGQELIEEWYHKFFD